MSKKYVKPHIKRAFDTAVETFAYYQNVIREAETNFKSAVGLFEQLSGYKFNINDHFADESEREDYVAPVTTEKVDLIPPVGSGEVKTTEPVERQFRDLKSLTDKIVFVITKHGKLSRTKIVEELLYLDAALTEKQINATFYSMVQRNIITSPVGYNGDVSVNPDRPEKKKREKNANK